MGRRNPNFRSGTTEDKRRWRSAKGLRCRACGADDIVLHLHHVVYEQHVRKRGGDVFDPDNSLTICKTCHLGHHAGKRLRVSCFRPQSLAFAERLLGPYADDYLKRYYDTGSVLDGLLAG